MKNSQLKPQQCWDSKSTHYKAAFYGKKAPSRQWCGCSPQLCNVSTGSILLLLTWKQSQMGTERDKETELVTSLKDLTLQSSVCWTTGALN